MDPVRGEIILVDENHGSILVYNRLDSTPPAATLLEPKRMIRGPETRITNNSGVYVDPMTGEIYSVSIDRGDRIVVFSRTAEGNVPPDRELHIPHRGFAIAADEEAQELFLSIEHPPAVVVYRKRAKGNEAPLRILEGSRTQLADVYGIALDTKNRWMYVANRGAVSSIKEGMGWSGLPIIRKEGVGTWNLPTTRGIGGIWTHYLPGSGRFTSPSITVYPLKASGDTPPLRVIQGPKTQLNWPAHIYLDLEHQELFVVDSVGDSILVFRATDSGNVAPVRVLQGTRTGLQNPYGVFVDEKNKELVVANFGNHTATVYPRTASGDTPPIRTIRTAPQGTLVPVFAHVGALDYDSKREEILVPSCITHPQLAAFAREAKSGDRPKRIIAGQATKLGRTMHDMRYDEVHDEIVIIHPVAQAILTFRGGARGEEPPLRVIQGPRTQMIHPDYVTVDPVHDELFVMEDDSLLVFSRTANGDVAPIRVIHGPDTGVNGRGMAVSVDPINDLLVVTTPGAILTFNRTDNGNVKPKTVIAGPKTGGIGGSHVRVYPPKGWILTPQRSDGGGGRVAVWSIHDNGDVPPRWLLGGPQSKMSAGRIALNPKAKEIIVGGGGSIRTYYFPEIF